MWRIGGGRAGFSSWEMVLLVLLRCFSHGSSMAFMSNTAKLVGGGWYTAGAVASIRLELAHPISSYVVFQMPKGYLAGVGCEFR